LISNLGNSSRRAARLGVVGAISLAGAAILGDATPATGSGPYRIQPLGFEGSHTTVTGLNAAGRAIGFSNASAGILAWYFDGNSMSQLGLPDANGLTNSRPSFINDAGEVAGISMRSSGVTSLGQSAWRYSQGATARLGFVDGPFLRSDGYANSFINGFNAAGQAVGYSEYYLGTQSAGWQAWLYTQGTSQPIGLNDAAHTAPDGTRFSSAQALNDSGSVVGQSGRYDATGYAGNSAWIYHAGQTTRIGLIDAEHTFANGVQLSQSFSVNALGHAAGRSDRGGSLGQSAWFYDGRQSRKIGLIDADHTRADGYRESDVDLLATAADVIAGHSLRYNGPSAKGQSAWRSDGIATARIGLTDTAHTSSQGTQFSRALYINASGNIAGYSEEYNGGTSVSGRSAWLDLGSTTHPVVITEPEHVNANGAEFVNVSAINALGQAIGTSNRYYGNASIGHSAWFYDPVTDRTTSLIFSLGPAGPLLPDDYAWTDPIALGDDGTVVGRFIDYSDHDYQPAYHAFSWSLAGGFNDLGTLVDGGLRENGWQALRDASFLNINGQIAGSGFANGADAFLLTPVPEPSITSMALAGAALLLRRRVRR
jgi:hypothetical protein